MKLTRENFADFYNKELNNKLHILEEERVGLLQGYILVIIIMAIAWWRLIYPIAVNANLLLHSLAGLAVILFFVFKSTFKNYKKKYKEKIVPLIFDHIFDRYDYLPDSHLSEEDYRSTMLFQGDYNNFSGDDFLEGHFLGTPTKMSELIVKHVNSNGKNKNERIVFKGLIIILNVHTSYHSETILAPDIAENLLGSFGKFFQNTDKSNHEVVRLESIEFEENFVVKSNNQIDARKILTPHVQEQIMHTLKRSKLKFGISITSSQFSIALPFSTNQFEPHYFTSNKNSRTIRDILDIFLLVKDFHQDFKIEYNGSRQQ
jgi:hypothetical protein